MVGRIFHFLLLLLVGLGLTKTALAWEYGTPAEAKALAVRAAEYYQAKGQEEAFRAFNQGSEGFRDRDLYVFVYDRNGTCISHGANLAMIGRNLIDLTDGDGKFLIRDIVAVQTADWVTFRWRNPQTHEIQRKKSFIVRVGDYVFGVGAYEPLH